MTSTSASVASARLFVRSPSSVRGLWIPGVSRNTICVASVGAHAAHLRARRLRPVGDDRDLAADELVQSVDLPTLGRPDDRDEPRTELTSLGARRSRRGSGPASAAAASRDARDDDRHDAPALHAFRAELEPVDRAHSPSIGNVAERVEAPGRRRCPTPLAGSSTSSSSLTSSIGVRPGHAERAARELLDLWARRRRTRR